MTEMEIFGAAVMALVGLWVVVVGPLVLSTWIRSQGGGEVTAVMVVGVLVGALASVVDPAKAVQAGLMAGVYVWAFERALGWKGGR